MKPTYKRVYFRINTPSYYNSVHGVGFGNAEESTLFHETIRKLFVNAGWQVKEEKYKSSGHCDTVTKNKQELYLHPQSASGVVLEENISDIEALLMSSSLFKFNRTDVYDDVYDMTEDEYISILESKKDEIVTDILAAFKTKRKNLFITSTFSILDRVLDKYRIKRLTHYVGVISSDNIDVRWINELFESLVNEKRITTAETRNGTGYRSVA